jgi:teichuronic acid biosynthesis glycosyltransferase TuaG
MKFVNGLVSVVMPAYQCQSFIEDSIKSVVSQTYKNIELIIVVDGGTDFTYDIVSNYCLIDSRIVMISHDNNLGIAEARNTGIRAASGEYIAFCDSDDIWLPMKLDIQLSIMKSSGASICHSSAFLINSSGILSGYRNAPLEIDLARIRRRNYIINSSAIYLRRNFPSIFQSQMRHEDYDFWLRLFEHGAISKGSNERLIKYRIHDNSVTNNKFKSIVWMCQVQAKHNIPSLQIFFNVLLNISAKLFEIGCNLYNKFRFS